jgi:hypothetical protein
VRVGKGLPYLKRWFASMGFGKEESERELANEKLHYFAED